MLERSREERVREYMSLVLARETIRAIEQLTTVQVYRLRVMGYEPILKERKRFKDPSNNLAIDIRLQSPPDRR